MGTHLSWTFHSVLIHFWLWLKKSDSLSFSQTLSCFGLFYSSVFRWLWIFIKESFAFRRVLQERLIQLLFENITLSGSLDSLFSDGGSEGIYRWIKIRTGSFLLSHRTIDSLSRLFIQSLELLYLFFRNLLSPRLFSTFFHSFDCSFKSGDIEDWNFLEKFYHLKDFSLWLQKFYWIVSRPKPLI